MAGAAQEVVVAPAAFTGHCSLGKSPSVINRDVDATELLKEKVQLSLSFVVAHG